MGRPKKNGTPAAKKATKAKAEPKKANSALKTSKP